MSKGHDLSPGQNLILNGDRIICVYIYIRIITAVGPNLVNLIVEYMVREIAAIGGGIRLGTKSNGRFAIGLG